MERERGKGRVCMRVLDVRGRERERKRHREGDRESEGYI